MAPLSKPMMISKTPLNPFKGILILASFLLLASLTSSNDTGAMNELRATLSPAPPSWSDSNFCNWSGVTCDSSSQVTSIDLSSRSLSGTLPSNLSSLSQLTSLSLNNNHFYGPIPLLSNLNHLQEIHLDSNDFSSIQNAAFRNLPALKTLTMSHNPYLSEFNYPSLSTSPNITTLEAMNTSMVGRFPTNLWWTPTLRVLKLSHNKLTGSITQNPPTYDLELRTLWLDDQEPGLNGPIDALAKMSHLTQVWLNDNAFNGSIPDLSNCSAIIDLQLKNNHLIGFVPETLTSLPNLMNISLQNNNLYGPYPDFPSRVKVELDEGNFCSSKPGSPCDKQVSVLIQVMEAMNFPTKLQNWTGLNACKWDFITCNEAGNVSEVNFRGQQFEGSIPSAFANLKTLKDLYLNDNLFSGIIPENLTTLPELEELDVSNNYLTGKMPRFRRLVRVNVTGNFLVADESTFDAAAASILNINNGSSSSDFGNPSHSGRQVKKFIGVFVSFSCVIVLGMVIILVRRYRMMKREDDEEERPWTEGLARRFAYEDLRSATGGFDMTRKLGAGGFGSVFRGLLTDGTVIAVKRLDRLGQGRKEFAAEVKTLGSIHHVHLVKLVGFCDENSHRMLVYEHMCNGSLDKWVFRQEGCGRFGLSVKKKIVVHIAKALTYLHEECQYRIAHLDIKPENILLDEKFNAKVSDFGLSKLIDRDESFVMTRMRGTRGYLAPEWLSRKITEKADVYSFGVVVLEVVFGRRNLEEEEISESLLVQVVKEKAQANEACDLLEGYCGEDKEEAEKMVKIAMWCLNEDPARRPWMSTVVRALEGGLDLSDVDSSANSYGYYLDGSSSYGDSSMVSASVLSGPR